MSQRTQQAFPFPYDEVFDAAVTVLPTIPLFVLNGQDRVLGRISASTRVSSFSWGEHFSIFVERVEDNNTLVRIESNLKLSFNIGGFSAARAHCNQFLAALSLHLQTRHRKSATGCATTSCVPPVVSESGHQSIPSPPPLPSNIPPIISASKRTGDISFYCFRCGQHIVIEVAGAGLQVKCPKCQSDLTVPKQTH